MLKLFLADAMQHIHLIYVNNHLSREENKKSVKRMISRSVTKFSFTNMCENNMLKGFSRWQFLP